MRCASISKQMSEYLDGRLSPGDEERMVEHLADCEACRREFDALKDAVTALHDLEPVEPPADLLKNVHARLDEQDRKATIIPFMFAGPQMRVALAAGLLIAVGLYGFQEIREWRKVGVRDMADLRHPPKKPPTPDLTAPKAGEARVQGRAMHKQEAQQGLAAMPKPDDAKPDAEGERSGRDGKARQLAATAPGRSKNLKDADKAMADAEEMDAVSAAARVRRSNTGKANVLQDDETRELSRKSDATLRREDAGRDDVQDPMTLAKEAGPADERLASRASEEQAAQAAEPSAPALGEQVDRKGGQNARKIMTTEAAEDAGKDERQVELAKAATGEKKRAHGPTPVRLSVAADVQAIIQAIQQDATVLRAAAARLEPGDAQTDALEAEDVLEQTKDHAEVRRRQAGGRPPLVRVEEGNEQTILHVVVPIADYDRLMARLRDLGHVDIENAPTRKLQQQGAANAAQKAEAVIHLRIVVLAPAR